MPADQPGSHAQWQAGQEGSGHITDPPAKTTWKGQGCWLKEVTGSSLERQEPQLYTISCRLLCTSAPSTSMVHSRCSIHVCCVDIEQTPGWKWSPWVTHIGWGKGLPQSRDSVWGCPLKCCHKHSQGPKDRPWAAVGLHHDQNLVVPQVSKLEGRAPQAMRWPRNCPPASFQPVENCMESRVSSPSNWSGTPSLPVNHVGEFLLSVFLIFYWWVLARSLGDFSPFFGKPNQFFGYSVFFFWRAGGLG